MVALTISLLSKFQKSDFLDKNVLTAKVSSFCAKIFGSVEDFFFSKMSVFEACSLHNEDRSE